MRDVPLTLASTLLAGDKGLPLLMLGPSLGTASAELWSPAAELLADRFQVVAWDLPGHGASPTEKRAFTIADIARAVSALVPRWGARQAFFAGVSVGGAVTLTIQLDSPGVGLAAGIVCSGARIGEPRGWRERAAQVRSSGTGSLVPTVAGRWFSPMTIAQAPELVERFKRTLVQVDDASYARCCEALAEYGVGDRLHEIVDPVLALWGEDDSVTPEHLAEEIAVGVRNGSYEVVRQAAHLAPIEQPEAVAHRLREFFLPTKHGVSPREIQRERNSNG
jgi:3-oxoadipate enol-lactonase